MREPPGAEQHCGAPEVEHSGEECADADNSDVDTLGGVVEGTWAELEGIRRKWETEPGQWWQDFGITVLGSAGAQAHVGVSADAIEGRARGEAVKARCWTKGVLTSAQVRDQGFCRVASRPHRPRLVLQDAALLLVAPHAAKRLCSWRHGQRVVGRAH